MASGGVGGAISAASDVLFNNPAQNDFLMRDGGYWKNMSVVGRLALATNGGAEAISTATASGATTLSLATANVFNITLSANSTFTFLGAVGSRACSFTLYLKQDATGGRTVSWGTMTVKWSGGQPTLSTAANAVDILVFETLDGGAIWYGSLVGTNFV